MENKITWETIGGDEYEGELIEIDNGTGYVKCTDGETRAIYLGDLFE